jgi:hypothetical protein
MIVDLPPSIDEKVICSIAAGVRYSVPVNLLLAVADREAGKPGQWVKNKNGTYDVGVLQFNTAYLASLRRWGIAARDAARPGCYPYNLAAWRLRGHLRDDSGDIWQRAANYHSRTPAFNARYRARLIPSAAQWARWLAARFPTHDLYKPLPPVSRPIPSIALGGAYVPRSITVSQE